MPIESELSEALAHAGIELPTEQVELLQAYARQLWDWNEKLNLTRHTSWEQFVSRDLRDCLQLAPLLAPGETVLDLGSGGGVPGIPLAILRPDLEVSLAESVGKRARVLNEIVQQLDLPVAVYAARGQELLEDFRFDTVVVRAVGSIAKLCQWIEPHWASVRRLLVIKGPRWVQERGEARHLGRLKGLQLRKVATYPLGAAATAEPCSTEPPETSAPESLSTGQEGAEQEGAAASEEGGAGEGVILQIWKHGAG